MKVLFHTSLFITVTVIACVLVCSCDPGFDTESYISNLSSYSVTIANYTFEGCESKGKHNEPLTIPSGGTVLFHQECGLGTSSSYNGSASFFNAYPDGCEISFEDGKKLHYWPVDPHDYSVGGDFETHSPYFRESHEFTMLDERFCYTYGKTDYIITDDDHDMVDFLNL